MHICMSRISCGGLCTAWTLYASRSCLSGIVCMQDCALSPLLCHSRRCSVLARGRWAYIGLDHLYDSMYR